MTGYFTSSISPRVVGAAWFGVWGLAAAGAIYLVPAVDRGDLPQLVLFVLLPGVAGAVAGAVVGPALLEREGVGAAKAAGLGLAAALLAHLVFGPVFAAGWWLFAGHDPGSQGVLGVALAATTLGVPMMGAVTLPAGALAGWLLHRIGRRG